MTEPKPDLELADLLTVTIDDVEVKVPRGTLAIRAAEQIGTQIPRFCDHPLLAPVGACRQCLVEVVDGGNGKPMPKPQTSCTLEVADNMALRTQHTSPVADKAQAGMMEFLLINHPLDCPVCDKGGECPLQNQAMSNGYPESRFDVTKRTFRKPINISARVLLDRERCVLCARCTRFADEIAGDPFIEMLERGALQQVGIYQAEPFESYFSGNVIQICPVGALTSADYRFRSRPFDLVSVPSIAEHDACGAAIRVDHRRGRVLRRLSGNDPDVNEEWIGDKDRFAFNYASTGDRLTHPLIRTDGELRPASWPEAIGVVADHLQVLLAGGGNAAVLTGGRLPLEDAYAYSKFARTVLQTNDIDFRARPASAEEADFLAAVVAGTPMDVQFDDLERASAVLLAGLEPEEDAPTVFLRLRKGVSRRSMPVYALAALTSDGVRKLSGTLIPTLPGDEAQVLTGLAGAGLATAGRRAADALDSEAIVLVGERLAWAPGALTAARELAERTGARLAWIPRRAGERAALEAGCLPGLLPGGRPVTDPAASLDTATAWGLESLPQATGRDTAGILAAAAGLDALLVAGVELADLPDPAAAAEALRATRFLVSLEVRASQVTELADVVLPVVPVVEKAGTFVSWEGRRRPFPAVMETGSTAAAGLSDLRVLAVLADQLDRPLGLLTAAQALAEIDELGAWDGARTMPPPPPPPAAAGSAGVEIRQLAGVDPGVDSDVWSGDSAAVVRLASWRLLIDDSRACDGEPHLTATGRRPVARMSAATAERAGLPLPSPRDRLDPREPTETAVVVSSEFGSVQLALEITEMLDDVVWLPTNSSGSQLRRDLRVDHGATVRVSPAANAPATSSELAAPPAACPAEDPRSTPTTDAP